MSPRKGRPTTDPKRHETRVRMTDEDVRILNECSQRMNTTKTEIIRHGIRLVKDELDKKE